MRLSIKTKLITVFLIVGLLPTLLISSLTSNTAQQSLNTEISNGLGRLAKAKSGQVFAYLVSLEQRTADFTSDRFIRESVAAITSNSSVEAVNSLNNYLVKDKQSLDDRLLAIYIINENGKVIASTLSDDLGEDWSGEDSFTQGKNGVAVTNVDQDEYPDLPDSILEVAAPIKNTDGSLLGVMVNLFSTEKLSSILSGEFQLQKGALSLNLSESGVLNTYLVNREKRVLAHGHKDAKEKEVETIDTLPVQECLNNKKEIIATYVNDSGEEVIGASGCFPDLGWTLLTETNANEALAPVSKMQSSLWLMTILFAIFIVFVALIFSNIVTKPIKKLTQVADDISKGKLHVKVEEIDSKDEIGDLARAFDRTVVSLKLAMREQKPVSGIKNQVSGMENKESTIDDNKIKNT